MSAPERKVIDTFLVEVVEEVASGYDFTGCSNQNPAYCNCETWTETICEICDQPIADGELIRRADYPADRMDLKDYRTEHLAWHVECPDEEEES